MNSRQPVAAGRFYEANPSACLADVQNCLETYDLPDDLPEKIAGGVVPHAGWVFSGPLAAMVFKAVKQQNENVDTFVIFGASHRFMADYSAVYESGSWQSPLGPVDIDQETARMITDDPETRSRADVSAHRYEHSIEVQIPFIRHLFPDARIVPVLVPPAGWASKTGSCVARVLEESQRDIVYIASTDLTHYGQGYGFCPEGNGPDAIEWAKNVNDREFIQAVLNLEAEQVFSIAQNHSSACGAAAVSSLVAAVKYGGLRKGKLLAHTHSSEIMKSKFDRDADESVGYAAIVF